MSEDRALEAGSVGWRAFRVCAPAARARYRRGMGFLDKAKKLAEQAQTKLDEVQKQGNTSGTTGTSGPIVEYDKHGRPIPQEQSTTPPHGDPLSGASAPPPVAGPATFSPSSSPAQSAPPPPPAPPSPPAPPVAATPGVPVTEPPPPRREGSPPLRSGPPAPVEASPPPPAPPGVPATPSSPPVTGGVAPPPMPGRPARRTRIRTRQATRRRS